MSIMLNDEPKRLDRDVIHYHGGIFRTSSHKHDFSLPGRMRDMEDLLCVMRVPYDNGTACIVSFIPPYEQMRRENRCAFSNLVEIYCKCELDVARQRDVKKLYRQAADGKIPHFTGMGDIFEEPTSPDLIVRTDNQSREDSFREVLRHPSIRMLCSRRHG